MNFHDLLSVAAQKQKQAEKQLGQKRYSTVVPPPKKEVKRVNTDAIKALLNKKDHDKQQKAVEDVQKRKEVKKSQKQALQNSRTKVAGKHEKVSDERTKSSQKDKHGANANKKNGQTAAVYKSKDHEKSHKKFMERVKGLGDKAKDKEIRREPAVSKRPSRAPVKKPMQGGPIDFSKLMELAAKKQHEPAPKPQRDDVTSRGENGRHRAGNHRELSNNHREPQRSNRETSRTHTGKRKGSDERAHPQPAKKPRLNGISVNNGKPETKNSSQSLQKDRKEMLNKSNKMADKHGQYRPREGAVLQPRPGGSGPKQRPQPTASASSSSRTMKADHQVARSQQRPPAPYGRNSIDQGPFKRPAARPPANVKLKRRQLDSESEDEDDDFIDDSPGDDVDVSSYIKEIFGYDKSRYGYESEYALRSMDASYSQIVKEEARSARIAMEEDLEDMRKEKEEIRRKAMKKAQSKK